MATLTDSQRAELVTTQDGVQLPYVINSIEVDPPTGVIDLSPLYGNGQIDIIGVGEGDFTVTVTLNGKTGVFAGSVEGSAEPGELVITLGPIRPR
jgi:hypothetical protein